MDKGQAEEFCLHWCMNCWYYFTTAPKQSLTLGLQNWSPSILTMHKRTSPAFKFVNGNAASCCEAMIFVAVTSENRWEGGDLAVLFKQSSENSYQIVLLMLLDVNAVSPWHYIPFHLEWWQAWYCQSYAAFPIGDRNHLTITWCIAKYRGGKMYKSK